MRPPADIRMGVRDLTRATTATMVGLMSPAHGQIIDNNGKPISFDGIDNSAQTTLHDQAGLCP